jgi:two-component system cell cycle response regulator DivK
MIVGRSIVTQRPGVWLGTSGAIVDAATHCTRTSLSIPFHQSQSGASARSPHGRTVLIVEDNDDNRLIYATYFRHAGYTVLEAVDGEAGLALARSASPDLILMDGGLPIIDGWTATRQLKADKATADVPVILLTAHVLGEHHTRSMSIGADAYLIKPADPKDVLCEIERLIGLRTNRSACENPNPDLAGA